ncbi:MAG: hypothetical protein FWC36_01885 [Spirochaetes bacterium]|nr:hypothetical protein [Spirochaetota bacterium]
MKTNLFSLLFFLIIVHFSFSETIRGQVRDIVIIDAEPGRVSEVTLSSESMFAIVLNRQESGPVRIQLEVRIPETLRSHPSIFALFFYNNITPAPERNISNYRGNLIKYAVLPSRQSVHFIDIFLKHQPTRAEIIPGTETITPRDFRGSPLPMLITMLPVMKGMPNHLLNETVRVRITPFFPESAYLTINVFERSRSAPDGRGSRISDYRLFIDNTPHNPGSNLRLPVGLRRVRIEKDGYTAFEESIVIRSNENNTITALLTSELPHVLIQAPPETEIFINGRLQTQREFSNLAAGEHTFVFRLGEYSISRRITLERNKRYLIDLLLDITVTEF